MKTTHHLLPAILCTLIFASCKSTESVGRVQSTGKLGDISKFEAENGDKGTMVWIDPKVNFSQFTKVYIRPISLRGKIDPNKKDKISSQDRAELSAYFTAALKRELGKDYTIVNSPSRGTLDFHFTVTRASKSVPLLDGATTLYPTAFLTSHVKKGVMGTHSFTGRSSMELEVKDGVTKRRVIGVLSARTGGKELANMFDSWNDVKAAMDHWAVGARERLAKLRKR